MRVLFILMASSVVAFGQGRQPLFNAYLQNNLDASTNSIAHLVTGTDPSNAATKGYVDAAVSSGSVAYASVSGTANHLGSSAIASISTGTTGTDNTQAITSYVWSAIWTWIKTQTQTISGTWNFSGLTFDNNHGQTDGAGGINNFNGFTRYAINGTNGSIQFDSGHITSDGSGNLTVFNISGGGTGLTGTASGLVSGNSLQSGIANSLGPSAIASVSDGTTGTDNTKAITSSVFASVWSWIKTQVQTISGVWTFSTNVTFNGTGNSMPNQAWIGDGTPVTGALGDIHYGLGSGMNVQTGTSAACLWTIRHWIGTGNASFSHALQWTCENTSGPPLAGGASTRSPDVNVFGWDLGTAYTRNSYGSAAIVYGGSGPVVLASTGSNCVVSSAPYFLQLSGTFTGTVGAAVSGTTSGASATVAYIYPGGGSIALENAVGPMFSTSDTLVVSGTSSGLSITATVFGNTPGSGLYVWPTQPFNTGHGVIEIHNSGTGSSFIQCTGDVRD